MNASLETFYFYCKIIGAVSSSAGILVGGFSWLRKTYNQAQNTSNNVTLLLTNHLPHLQESLNKQDSVLSTLSSDVRNVNTTVRGIEQRQEDLRYAVRNLNDSFLRHLEASVEDSKKPKR